MYTNDQNPTFNSTEIAQNICYAPVSRRLGRRDPIDRDGLSDPALRLDPDTLREVFNNNGTLVHLLHALPATYCARVVAAAARVPFQAYAKTENSTDYEPILKFGPTMFDHIGQDDKSEYFQQGRRAVELGSAAFSAAGVTNPLTVALRALREAWPGPVGVAREANGQAYFAGVMRDIPSGAIPHVDDAHTETPEMAIGDVVAQASMLFYVMAPTAGGALRVYDKTPTAQDYRDHVVGYGFADDAVHNASFRGVTPGVGTVVLFPTTQIHSVDPVRGDGRRISWSTFIGLRADGSLILWS